MPIESLVSSKKSTLIPTSPHLHSWHIPRPDNGLKWFSAISTTQLQNQYRLFDLLNANFLSFTGMVKHWSYQHRLSVAHKDEQTTFKKAVSDGVGLRAL
jgi:hypothetical protein